MTAVMMAIAANESAPKSPLMSFIIICRREGIPPSKMAINKGMLGDEMAVARNAIDKKIDISEMLIMNNCQ